MAEVETLGILEEIEALISDKLQVVSYKWLSRNFLLSSNAAKKLLQDFVEKNEGGFEAVYALSGPLKKNSSEYHVKLVPGHKLSEAKHEFENCSAQVYSVQACLPKDPASLWNTEFIQAEELFRQPPDVDNCLRDNRFCAISNPFVKRNLNGATSTISPHSQKAGLPANGLEKKTAIPPESTLRKSNESSTADKVKAIKTETYAKDGVHEQAGKLPSDKFKASTVHHEKPKDQGNKTTSGNGSSLANMWSRTSAKTKSNSIMEETKTSISNLSEAANSDEDDCGVNFRRTSKGDSGRKRKVVCDFSDDENDNEDAISLASPDPPRGKSLQGVGPDTKPSISNKSSLDLHKPKMEGSTTIKGNKARENVPEISSNKNDRKTDAVTSSPKRRKVLKTRIDDRGREVNEVVWEGEDGESKDDKKGSSKNEDNKTTVTSSSGDRPAVAKKSPAAAPGNTLKSNAATSGKSAAAGLKKGGKAKDPKQGNIMSFFKKA